MVRAVTQLGEAERNREKPGAPCSRAETGHAQLERMFYHYGPFLRRAMPRLGVAAHDIDDLTQEIFLAVHRGLRNFERRSTERTWMYGICIRVCSNYRRRAHRRREQPTALPADAHGALDMRQDYTPEHVLQTKQLLALLDGALDLLPEVQRETYVLHEIEQLSVNEIADIFGCSKFTVYARLRSARKQVLAQVSSQGCPEADREARQDSKVDHG